jgi:hypothetical protein
MRRIDTSDMTIVHVGKQWTHPSPPCNRDMTLHLENQESWVYWFQPSGGSPQDQVPALKYQGEFYTLSLRMMKSIWRRTRLKKGFSNLERGHFGSYKLRIPTLLMQEKTRTQGRINVRVPVSHCCGVCTFGFTIY